MSGDSLNRIDGMVAIAIVCVMLGWIIGAQMVDKTIVTKIKKEAVENGFAEYNQDTGKWQWKEPSK